MRTVLGFNGRALIVAMAATSALSHEMNKDFQEHQHLHLLGSSYIMQDPSFEIMLQQHPEDLRRRLLQPRGDRKLGSSSSTTKSSKKSRKQCDPDEVELLDYPQWQQEVGYWIGDYTLLGPTAQPFESSTWNYPYGAYKGFITGNVKGNAYRQRNVFLYPPQNDPDKCVGTNTVLGDGICGENGNTRIFEADQQASTCSDNEELAGDIEGIFDGLFFTKTELVGRDNSLLYQVYFPLEDPAEDLLQQSQLTTLETDLTTGRGIRVRTAQLFNLGTQAPDGASFYRERQVTKEEFYQEFDNYIMQYNITESDLCRWEGFLSSEVPEGGSLEYCIAHLEESFEL